MPTTFFLFVAFLAYTNAWPIYRTGDLRNPGDPIKVTPFRINLETEARIEVTHNKPVQLCFQADYDLPQNPDTWNQTCSLHMEYRATAPIIHTGIARLRNVTYTVGIYSLNGFENQTDIRLKLGNVNDTCSDSEIFDIVLDQCRAPDGVLHPDTPETHPFEPGATKFFTFTIDTQPNLAGSVSIKNMATGLGNLIFQIRYAGSPTYGVHDGSSGSVAVLNYPKPGKYVVAVTSTDLVPSSGSFMLHVEICSIVNTNQTAGPGCLQPYEIASQPFYKRTAVQNVWSYWRVTVTPHTPLWVSVRSFDGLKNPRLYATKGQLPRAEDIGADFDNIDFLNCNQFNCQGANVIRHVPTEANELWYIGVLPAEGANGTSYTIWFDTICAPGCTDHGKCIDAGPTAGTCECDAKWGGVACDVSYKATPENIVLYIIAGLVLFSGVAAFIGAMVTKKPKKPREYENV